MCELLIHSFTREKYCMQRHIQRLHFPQITQFQQQ